MYCSHQWTGKAGGSRASAAGLTSRPPPPMRLAAIAGIGHFQFFKVHSKFKLITTLCCPWICVSSLSFISENRADVPFILSLCYNTAAYVVMWARISLVEVPFDDDKLKPCHARVLHVSANNPFVHFLTQTICYRWCFLVVFLQRVIGLQFSILSFEFPPFGNDHALFLRHGQLELIDHFRNHSLGI